MTVEYILLMTCMLLIGLKFMVEAPKTAFQNSGPVLAQRVEKHLRIGEGFIPANDKRPGWQAQ